MRTFDEQLARETAMMGRPCTFLNGWEYAFTGREGEQKTVRVMVYAVAPLKFADDPVMYEDRVVVWDGVKNTTSTIVEGEEEL